MADADPNILALAELPTKLASAFRQALAAAFPDELDELDLLRVGGSVSRAVHEATMEALDWVPLQPRPLHRIRMPSDEASA